MKPQGRGTHSRRTLREWLSEPVKFTSRFWLILPVVAVVGLLLYYLVLVPILHPVVVLVDVTGVAEANLDYGTSFTVPLETFQRGEPIVEVHLRLTDPDAKILYTLYTCADSECTSGIEVAVDDDVDSNEVRLRFRAVDKGVDRHFFFQFAQPRDFVPETEFRLTITLHR